MADTKDDVVVPEGQKVLSDGKGGHVLVDEDTKKSDLNLDAELVANDPPTKLVNNDENVLPGLEAKQETRDDSDESKEPEDRARSKGGKPLAISPSNIGVEGKPSKKDLKQHPTADHEVTFGADAPNSSHQTDPMTAAEVAKRARIEGQADGQRQRCSTWWHPKGRILDGESEVRANDGEILEDTTEGGFSDYNHY